MTGLFLPLPDKTRKAIGRLPEIIEKTFPLPGRYRTALPHNVAELSELFTSKRTERGSSYLGKPALLSAYLRYFLPWNIYRLSRLFGSLNFNLKPDDAVIDLGAGPLTLAASLWISRPNLRTVPLEFRCLDLTPAILEAGKKFFYAVTGEIPPDFIQSPGQSSPACPWTFKTIRGEIRKNGTLSTEIRGKPAALTSSVNVYNEMYWSFSPLDKERLELFAERQAHLLSSLTETTGSILVAEPGIPRAGEFISLLRSGFLKEGRTVLYPCTHSNPCPIPGGNNGGNIKGKAKWCHFAFNTTDAPEELHRLSAAAHIPKERAVLSFILAGPASIKRPELNAKVRIISDSFPASEQGQNIWGRYCCSNRGLVLVTGSRKEIDCLHPGSLEELRLVDNEIDAKSGALLARRK